MPNTDDSHSGHRQRLRERFLAYGARDLPETELLEMLLTYAIPRRDVAPLARQLLERFGSLQDLLAASYEELNGVPGVGEQTAILIRLVAALPNRVQLAMEPPATAVEQPELLHVEPDLGPLFSQRPTSPTVPFRTFTNDLSVAALEYLPHIADFQDMQTFQDYLEQNLPYNSFTSRQRYARNLISRFYPGESVHTPLTMFLSYKPDPSALGPVLFYETARNEPAVRLVAEEVVWPAVPVGHLPRLQLRERLQVIFPGVGVKTIERMLYSLFNVYTILNQAQADKDALHFQTHPGTFEAFLYVLTAEFPEPGMYRFEKLEQGPMRTWLLWDREWMERQLYNLRDFGILSKVSQIDTLRQFTVECDQGTALRRYFEHPERRSLALRDQPQNGAIPYGEGQL